MKQLYIIGIAVAVILMLLLGLSKLSTPPATPANVESARESLADDAVIDSPEEPIINDEEVTQTPMTENQENTTIVMKTNKGDVTMELFTKDAPITAGNFLTLAKQDFYDGVKFHRVIDGFMIQGGDPLSKDDSLSARWGTGGPDYAIDDEFVPGLSNVRGTLSMANSGPNTGGSQFFINTVDNTFLDNKHAVFGRVTSGMEVVDAISKTKTGAGDRPVEPVVITDIEVK